MDFADSPEEAAFRDEVRKFLKDELPEGLARKGGGGAMFGGGGRSRGGDYFQKLMPWLNKLSERGWVAPAWPKEYGGAGLTVIEQFILSQEMATTGAPKSPNVIGLGWVGPTLILHGTDEQKEKHLRPILDSKAWWCQGFSEPEAGSDLASIQTRAVRDGDDYIINGQKIWTSGAQIAQWMILLTRTDPDAPKHKGISYFLLDMKTPGIEVRPLTNMAGSQDFNEVFFDNVRIPKENLVGEENRGWYIGTATLDFERSGIATGVSHSLTVQELVKFQQEHGNGDSMMRYELADRAIESEVELMLNHKVIGVQARGMVPSNEATVAKLYSSELDQRIAGTGMKLMGVYAQLSSDSKYAEAAMGGRFASTYMYATTSTIGGGTSEIQRNIIAQRGLGLPRD
ncbi:MAG: acyl-CoA dehydrogenase family protein [Chloroflexi bacterium]|nr:acyl-CoA dehydrogenase family protein [Chloroflexota bacterium]MCI0856738.1 acyl-CoA dehydrogenase family protein [Chloroflexota bacterium]MCI0890406.1 acyl-CoA dehydrogenase family protein [Chloroflexota bacterium]